MTKKHIITLGGFPGSGKSTVKKMLGDQLGYTTFSTGDFTRRLSNERGMTLEEFNEHVAGGAKELDHLIDDELMRIEREEDKYVIDSHLAFHFVPSAFSVYLDISLETSALRIFHDRDAEIRILSGDTMKTLEEAELRIKKRIDNHRDRYMRHYGIDPYVSTQYMLAIHTENLTPEVVTEKILIAYQDWQSA